MADVAAELDAFEGYLRELGVGLVEGGLQVGGRGGDGKDATSGGDDLTISDGCAGVKDDYVVILAVRQWEAGDGLARDVFAGITAAGCNDADAGAGAHPDGELVGCAIDGGVEEVDDVSFEAEENSFGLGIAEASVEFEDHGAPRGHHDAAEEDALERVALRAHAVDNLLRDIAQEPLAHGRRGDAVGGVSPHPTRVRTGVAFANAFVVLGRGDLDGVSSVAECEEGEFFAGEELFEDDLGLHRAEEHSAEHLCRGLFRFEMSIADDDAFAGGEARRFDDDRHGKAAELFVNLFEASADGVGRGGDVVTLHELFGKGFACFELGCGLRGAEDAVAAFGQLIDQANREREFRTDDSQGWLLDRDDVDHLVEIAGIDGNAAGELSDAAVAGGAKHFCDLRRFAECPDKGVLASSTTDYQNLHPLMRSTVFPIRNLSSRLGIAGGEVKQCPYLTATEMASAREWLSRAGFADAPIRTW